jgi:hypothetical protein
MGRQQESLVRRHLMRFETITQKETTACQEIEACLDEEKPTSLDRKPEAAEQ